MSAIITQKVRTLFLDTRDRSVFIGISAGKGAIEMELSLAEARVLFVELERALNKVNEPRSQWVTE